MRTVVNLDMDTSFIQTESSIRSNHLLTWHGNMALFPNMNVCASRVKYVYYSKAVTWADDNI